MKPTPRQLEVLQLLADGHSPHEIAAHLVVTYNTVRTHIRQMRECIGAPSMAVAVAIALRQGWIR